MNNQVDVFWLVCVYMGNVSIRFVGQHDFSLPLFARGTAYAIRNVPLDAKQTDVFSF